MPDLSLSMFIALLKSNSPSVVGAGFVLFILGRIWRQIERHWEHERRLQELETAHRQNLDLQVLERGLGAAPGALNATVDAIRDLRDDMAESTPEKSPGGHDGSIETSPFILDSAGTGKHGTPRRHSSPGNRTTNATRRSASHERTRRKDQ